MQAVKSLISKYKKPFNREKRALAKAKKNLRERGDKATKAAVEDEVKLVLEEWETRTTFGEEAHTQIRKQTLAKYPEAIYEPLDFLSSDLEDTFIPEETNNLQLNTLYLEKRLVSNLYKIVGYADELHVDAKGYIHITEIKSFRTLRRTYTAKADNGFLIIDNFFHPINHLIDCNYIETALQASFYMYLAWLSNKHLKPGTITIKHLKLDEDTGFILETKTITQVPYLLNEVKAIIKEEKLKYDQTLI